MTMPPQQPLGPYGPPQPPNPYAQQPHPQQQYQQFPAQQQYPGYPGHQGQPYPGQGPWGQPPMGPPPRKNPAGKIIGSIFGAIALVVGLLVLSWFGNRGSDARSSSEASFPSALYKIAVVETLLDGEYKLAQDMSQTEGRKITEGTYDPDIRDPKPAVARYSAGPATSPSVMVISGMYGQFKSPDDARRKMLKGAGEADGATVVVPLKEISPAGSDVTLSCQVLTSVQGGTTVTVPMCAWADANTGASVAEITPEISRQDPASVDLDKVAETTVKVREEVRKPIG